MIPVLRVMPCALPTDVLRGFIGYEELPIDVPRGCGYLILSTQEELRRCIATTSSVFLDVQCDSLLSAVFNDSICTVRVELLRFGVAVDI